MPSPPVSCRRVNIFRSTHAENLTFENYHHGDLGPSIIIRRVCVLVWRLRIVFRQEGAQT